MNTTQAHTAAVRMMQAAARALESTSAEYATNLMSDALQLANVSESPVTSDVERDLARMRNVHGFTGYQQCSLDDCDFDVNDWDAVMDYVTGSMREALEFAA